MECIDPFLLLLSPNPGPIKFHGLTEAKIDGDICHALEYTVKGFWDFRTTLYLKKGSLAPVAAELRSPARTVRGKVIAWTKDAKLQARDFRFAPPSSYPFTDNSRPIPLKLRAGQPLPAITLRSEGRAPFDLSALINSKSAVLIRFLEDRPVHAAADLEDFAQVSAPYRSKGLSVVAALVGTPGWKIDGALASLAGESIKVAIAEPSAPGLVGAKRLPLSILVGRQGKVLSVVEGYDEAALIGAMKKATAR